MTPQVSIVIPVFNKASWITETLSSVMTQTFRDWEAIIIDDGSTDDSLSVIRDFVVHHPGAWTVISQKNQGQCEVRNRGIKESSGEFIAFLDGDDCWAENKLEVQVQMLSENKNAALVLCPYLIYDSNVTSRRGRLVLHRNSKKMLRRWLSLRGFGGGTESTGLVRRELLRSAGGFDTELSTSAGLDLTMRLSKLGEILFANNTYMKYRIHTGQWHTNLDILSMDLKSLRKKISESEDLNLSRMEMKHYAYLRLQELRQGVLAEQKTGSGRRIRIYFYLSILVYFMLERNLAARARAIFPGLLTKIPVDSLRGNFS